MFRRSQALPGGLDPDPWQSACAREIMTTQSILLLCARQCGKSETDAAMVLLTILLTPPALVLIVGPTERQGLELLAYKFMPMYEAWRELCPMKKGKDLVNSKEFVNGSRIVVLPDKEGNIRSYSRVNLIVLDEASRVTDPLYRAVRPMLSISRGRLMGSSTAFGQRGWFYEEWINPARPWARFDVKGADCKRHSKRFLEQERLHHGERWFLQEYCNDFAQAVGAVFSPEDIKGAFNRVSEDEAWLDLFGSSVPGPNIVQAQPLEL